MHNQLPGPKTSIPGSFVLPQKFKMQCLELSNVGFLRTASKSITPTDVQLAATSVWDCFQTAGANSLCYRLVHGVRIPSIFFVPDAAGTVQIEPIKYQN